MMKKGFFLKFPDMLLSSYLQQVSAASVEKLTATQVHTVFLQALDDYFNGKLSLDELSSIGGKLWYRSMNLKTDEENKELFDILYKTDELSYVVRRDIPKVSFYLSQIVAWYRTHIQETNSVA